MQYLFYDSKKYKLKQSSLTRENWKKGKFNFLYRRIQRRCARTECKNNFSVIPSNLKKYCSRNCAAIVNNTARKWPEIVKQKISLALRGRPSPYKGIVKVPHLESVCQNPSCGKRFFTKRWKKPRYCGNQCAMSVIGGRTTSPKASRGKAGIRKDINPTVYFYSRWEANIARLYTHLKISWIYAPASFDIGGKCTHQIFISLMRTHT